MRCASCVCCGEKHVPLKGSCAFGMGLRRASNAELPQSIYCLLTLYKGDHVQAEETIIELYMRYDVWSAKRLFSWLGDLE